MSVGDNILNAELILGEVISEKDEIIGHLSDMIEKLMPVVEAARNETFAEQMHSHCVSAEHKDMYKALDVVLECRSTRNSAVWKYERIE